VTISNPGSVSSSKAEVYFEIRGWKCTYLNELNVNKPLVVSVTQRTEELRLYNLGKNVMKISNHSLKAASSNATPA
jgi:hypothetical protein